MPIWYYPYCPPPGSIPAQQWSPPPYPAAQPFSPYIPVDSRPRQAPQPPTAYPISMFPGILQAQGAARLQQQFPAIAAPLQAEHPADMASQRNEIPSRHSLHSHANDTCSHEESYARPAGSLVVNFGHPEHCDCAPCYRIHGSHHCCNCCRLSCTSTRRNNQPVYDASSSNESASSSDMEEFREKMRRKLEKKSEEKAAKKAAKKEAKENALRAKFRAEIELEMKEKEGRETGQAVLPSATGDQKDTPDNNEAAVDIEDVDSIATIVLRGRLKKLKTSSRSRGRSSSRFSSYSKDTLRHRDSRSISRNRSRSRVRTVSSSKDSESSAGSRGRRSPKYGLSGKKSRNRSKSRRPRTPKKLGGEMRPYSPPGRPRLRYSSSSSSTSSRRSPSKGRDKARGCLRTRDQPMPGQWVDDKPARNNSWGGNTPHSHKHSSKAHSRHSESNYRPPTVIDDPPWTGRDASYAPGNDNAWTGNTGDPPANCSLGRGDTRNPHSNNNGFTGGDTRYAPTNDNAWTGNAVDPPASYSFGAGKQPSNDNGFPGGDNRYSPAKTNAWGGSARDPPANNSFRGGDSRNPLSNNNAWDASPVRDSPARAIAAYQQKFGGQDGKNLPAPWGGGDTSNSPANILGGGDTRHPPSNHNSFGGGTRNSPAKGWGSPDPPKQSPAKAEPPKNPKAAKPGWRKATAPAKASQSEGWAAPVVGAGGGSWGQASDKNSKKSDSKNDGSGSQNKGDFQGKSQGTTGKKDADLKHKISGDLKQSEGGLRRKRSLTEIVRGLGALTFQAPVPGTGQVIKAEQIVKPTVLQRNTIRTSPLLVAAMKAPKGNLRAGILGALRTISIHQIHAPLRLPGLRALRESLRTANPRMHPRKIILQGKILVHVLGIPIRQAILALGLTTILHLRSFGERSQTVTLLAKLRTVLRQEVVPAHSIQEGRLPVVKAKVDPRKHPQRRTVLQGAVPTPGSLMHRVVLALGSTMIPRPRCSGVRRKLVLIRKLTRNRRTDLRRNRKNTLGRPQNPVLGHGQKKLTRNLPRASCRRQSSPSDQSPEFRMRPKSPASVSGPTRMRKNQYWKRVGSDSPRGSSHRSNRTVSRASKRSSADFRVSGPSSLSIAGSRDSWSYSSSGSVARSVSSARLDTIHENGDMTFDCGDGLWITVHRPMETRSESGSNHSYACTQLSTESSCFSSSSSSANVSNRGESQTVAQRPDDVIQFPVEIPVEVKESDSEKLLVHVDRHGEVHELGTVEPALRTSL